jgi:hypothetical protein
LRHGTLKDAGTPLPAVAGFQTFGRGRISAFANRNSTIRVKSILLRSTTGIPDPILKVNLS